jgi:hypothetical protein
MLDSTDPISPGAPQSDIPPPVASRHLVHQMDLPLTPERTPQARPQNQNWYRRPGIQQSTEDSTRSTLQSVENPYTPTQRRRMEHHDHRPGEECKRRATRPDRAHLGEDH